MSRDVYGQYCAFPWSMQFLKNGGIPLRDMITEFSLRGGSAFAQAAIPAPIQSNKRNRQDGTEEPTYIQQLSQVASPMPNSGTVTPSASLQSPFNSQFAPTSASTMHIPQRQFPQSYVTQAQNAFSGGQPTQPLQGFSGTHDLDLSSLMLAQMGYFQSPGNNFNPVAFSPRLHNQPSYAHLTEPIESYGHLFPPVPTPDDVSAAGAMGGGSSAAFSSGAIRPTMGQQQTGSDYDPYDMSVWMSNPQVLR